MLVWKYIQWIPFFICSCLLVEVKTTKANDDGNIEYIDSHIHILEHKRFLYPGLHPNSDPMQANYTSKVYERDTSTTPVKYAIVIEVASDWQAELDFLIQESCQHNFIRGIVAGIPLNDNSFEEKLAKYADGQYNRLLVGVRNYVIGAKPFYTNKTLWPALEVLQKTGKVLDVIVGPRELANFTNVVEAFPNLTFVLEHLSVLTDLSEKDIWEEGLAAMAKYPNVFMKISTFLVKDDGYVLFGGKIRANKIQPRFQALKPIVDYVLQVFGPDRCIYGSDWPVGLVGYDHYTDIYNMANRLLENVTAADRQKIFYSNAVRIYRLDMKDNFCENNGAGQLGTHDYILKCVMQASVLIISQLWNYATN